MVIWNVLDLMDAIFIHYNDTDPPGSGVHIPDSCPFVNPDPSWPILTHKNKGRTHYVSVPVSFYDLSPDHTYLEILSFIPCNVPPAFTMADAITSNVLTDSSFVLFITTRTTSFPVQSQISLPVWMNIETTTRQMNRNARHPNSVEMICIMYFVLFCLSMQI